MYKELTQQVIDLYEDGRWSLEDLFNHLTKSGLTPFLNCESPKRWSLSFVCNKRQYGSANTLTILHNHKNWFPTIKEAVIQACQQKLEH